MNVRLMSVVVAVLVFTACGTAADLQSGDETTGVESDVKIVHPKGGNGYFKLLGPDFEWATDAGVSLYSGSFSFGGSSIAVGQRVQKTQNTYALGAAGNTDQFGAVAPTGSVSVTVDAGVTTAVQLGGLQVRFDRPLTLGLGTVSVSNGTSGGSTVLNVSDLWARLPDGARMLSLPQTFNSIKVDYETSGRPALSVAPGQKAELVLPTVQFEASFDTLDPAFPTSGGSCGGGVTLSLYDGWSGRFASMSLRASDGTGAGPVTIPTGSNLSWNFSTAVTSTGYVTTNGTNIAIRLSRLEIDDVEVTQADGTVSLARGTYTVAPLVNGAYANPTCTFPTHTGLDLPDGTYRVVSSTTTTTGVISYTQDVTLP